MHHTDYIPFSSRITKRETDFYTLQALDKAPREDNVTGKILLAA